MDMSSTERDKRRPSALEILARVSEPEDPVTKGCKRLQKEIMELLRISGCAPKACLRKPGGILNSLEEKNADLKRMLAGSSSFTSRESAAPLRGRRTSPSRSKRPVTTGFRSGVKQR